MHRANWVSRILFETTKRQDYNGLTAVSIYMAACAIGEHDESRLYHRRVPFTSPRARVNNSLYSQFTQLLL